jgi:hypothetical protein
MLARPALAPREMAFRESIELAEEIMRQIEHRWPANRILGKNRHKTHSKANYSLIKA